MSRKFNNIGDVRQWIEDNVKLEDGRDAQEAAIWWIAVGTAGALYDLSTKELARELMDGIPKVDASSVNRHLDELYEDMGEEANEEVEADLRAFFALEDKA